MVKVKRPGKFDQMLENLCAENIELRKDVEQCIVWFKRNPNDTRLDNHPLLKSLEGKWAFSITKDIRIIYEWVGKSTVRFLAIGGHNEIYLRAKPRLN